MPRLLLSQESELLLKEVAAPDLRSAMQYAKPYDIDLNQPTSSLFTRMTMAYYAASLHTALSAEACLACERGLLVLALAVQKTGNWPASLAAAEQISGLEVPQDPGHWTASGTLLRWTPGHTCKHCYRYDAGLANPGSGNARFTRPLTSFRNPRASAGVIQLKAAREQPKRRSSMERERMGLGSCIFSSFLVLLALALLIQLVFYGLAKVELREVQAKLGVLKAEGMPVTWTDLAAAPQPAATNGATYYLEADAALKFETDEEDMLADVPKLALEGKLDAEALGKAKVSLERHHKALALVARGNQQPRTVFPINWEEGMQVSFAHLTKLRKAGQSTGGPDSLVLAADGKPERAMASFQEGINLETASSEERTLITQMVRIAIQEIALRSLEASLSFDPFKVSSQAGLRRTRQD